MFSCKYRSLLVIPSLTAPQGKYQPHPGAVCAWWEGFHEAMDCNVTTAAFCTVPELCPACQHGATGQALLLGCLVLRFGSAVQLQYGCTSGCFSGRVNHSGNCYQNQGCSPTEDLLILLCTEGAHVQALASGCVQPGLRMVTSHE